MYNVFDKTIKYAVPAVVSAAAGYELAEGNKTFSVALGFIACSLIYDFVKEDLPKKRKSNSLESKVSKASE